VASSDEAEMYKEENMRLKDYLNDFTRENEELKKIKEAMDTQAIIDANSGNISSAVQDTGDGEKHV
jgi:hypothetical protein